MPTLDSCINSTFQVGNIPASSGETPVRVVLGTSEDPEDYDPDAQTYALKYYEFFNSGYVLLLMV